MPVDVIMPQMGESIFEGTVTKWLKKVGEKVERDEPLFEISTDKVDAEIPSPAAGVLKEIKVAEGATVQINTVVGIIDAEGIPVAPAPAKEVPAPPPPPAVPAAAAAPSRAEKVVPMPPVPPSARPAARAEEREIRSSPLVRRLAREHGIDISTITGTGAGGRISKQDILAAIAAGPAPAKAPAAAAPGAALAPAALPREKIYFGRYEVQPLSVMRQRIAEHMVMSKHTSAHVYTVFRVDMSRVVELRESSKAAFEQMHEIKLTFMPFFARAAVEALRAFPIVNASLDGDKVVLHRDINIGIAVALDWGLIVPVVKHADEMSFLGLQRAISDLAERARTKKLKPEEVHEGTFTITNPGIFGGLLGLPVISQPQVAILGVGGIHKEPVVINDAIAIRSVVYLTLSFDHRLIDGAVADQFMAKLKAHLEGWEEKIL
jgi:2-oxoglutarate dehydrogenase E2 component (dihydrolipoamide succinyltransferase)